MAITIIVLVTRFGIAKIKWKRAVGLDEIFLSLALLCAMIESALTEHAVRRGLGTYIRPGNSAKLRWLSQVRSIAEFMHLMSLTYDRSFMLPTCSS